MLYKRNKVFICVLIAIVTFFNSFCIGCVKSNLPPIKQPVVYKDFSVNYIDVGQGDCIFIRLPDGKNLLIDTGLNDEYLENSKYVINFLNRYSVKKIDYFILTHPDLDHVGNAQEIINTFSIGTIYLPIISNKLIDNFIEFKKILQLVNEKHINSVTSDYSLSIVGENYKLAFLSPAPLGISGSSYAELESSIYPTDRQINDLSPIIYLECFDKRFIFTGDATNTQERIVINNYNIGVYDHYFKNKGIEVDLEEVDYLKVSHHGADGATCSEFLSLLKPKNFIISVGKDNFYGHPRSEVLERILEVCPQSKLYRTDEAGTITVHKNNKNEIVVSTTKQN